MGPEVGLEAGLGGFVASDLEVEPDVGVGRVALLLLQFLNLPSLVLNLSSKFHVL